MPQQRMTKTDIVNAVREITEMDAADVSDTVVEIYLRDGYNRIIDLERRWSFLETTLSLTTTAGQDNYVVNDFTAEDIREVISVMDSENNRLQYISYDAVEETILDTLLTNGVPSFFSFWDGEMFLYPTPAESDTLTIRAYKYPTDWVSDDVAPDGSASFDMALVYYAISRIYQAQEELNTASTYERMFNDTVTLARRDLTRPPSAAPVVFAGGRQFRAYKGKGGYGW